MSGSRHAMILASAGSGKTYELTNRFVALLAGGAAPERIVALTFTRKAAGEFFDQILGKLAGAAGNPDEAARLAREIEKPSLGSADFLPMLRRVVESMHRLRLGTMDSFFARIVRAFPLELGLTRDLEILQEHGALMERRRVLQRLFARPPSGLAESQRDFIEEFKRATFGAEEKRLSATLDRFLDAHQQTYLEAPDAGLWGNAARIWPGGNPWLGRAADLAAPLRAMRAWLGAAELGEKQRLRWEGFLEGVGTWAPGAAPDGPIEYVLKKALADWDDLRSGRAELKFDKRKQPLDGAACAALSELVRHLVSGEFNRRLETTRGIHAVVREYEAAYDDAVRRSGKLTFSDVQRLLQPQAGAAGGGLPDRLSLDYRLDGGVDHWLLDEFQDTSFGQWSILRNLIDEAVQDTDGRRSFFCVGDTKQAIFVWREGDPRLFGEIFRHYNSAAPGTIVERHLSRSWRSGPPLVEMVNRVFGSGEALGRLFPGAVAKTWAQAWREHESAKPELGGQAALLHAADEDGRWALCLRVLEEINPLARGLSCAILVQKNETGTALADFLRREGGQPAVAESDLHVCNDNPLGAALLALFHAAAHPGDTLAWEHVRMTPLGKAVLGEGLADSSMLSNRVLRQVHGGGFERTAEDWLRLLEPRLRADDAFSRERARQFAVAAAEFDGTGSRDLDEFVDFMERHTVRDAEGADAVRVMTIHKAKGLGFDVVLLPDLEGRTPGRRREGLAVHKGPDRSVQWILEMPTRVFRESDPVLEAHVREEEEEAFYEKLSLLYVAMTRAKRATYAIIEPAGDSESANFPRLLGETLGEDVRPVRIGSLSAEGAWAGGDSDWHLKIETRRAAPDGALESALLDPGRTPRAARRPARRPSAELRGPITADQLFTEGAEAEFGTSVHELLARVEWADSAEAARIGAAWDLRGPAGVEARACLEAPELASVWERPRSPQSEVWRERAFETLLDDSWVSGILDRAVVRRDASGKAVSAIVYDFKTGAPPSDGDPAVEAERHSGQLNLYRRAVAALAGLPVEAVDCKVVFTRLRRAIPVPA
ncbi:MAG: UvrD-helicase domain-containing protein [Opitutaceae bacterium]